MISSTQFEQITCHHKEYTGAGAKSPQGTEKSQSYLTVFLVKFTVQLSANRVFVDSNDLKSLYVIKLSDYIQYVS